MPGVGSGSRETVAAPFVGEQAFCMSRRVQPSWNTKGLGIKERWSGGNSNHLGQRVRGVGDRVREKAMAVER